MQKNVDGGNFIITSDFRANGGKQCRMTIASTPRLFYTAGCIGIRKASPYAGFETE